MRRLFGGGTFLRAFLKGAPLFFACLLVSAPVAEAVPEVVEQEQRALEIRLAISRLVEDQVKERETLYDEIVKSCPKTEAAEEALWALSNLYLDAFPEPQERKAQEALELLLKRYPDSIWGIQVRSRLVLLYSETEHRKRAAELCRELLEQRAEELPASYRPFLALIEAEVWDKSGEKQRAKEAYTLVVRSYPGTPQAERADRLLAAMDSEKTKEK